MLTQNYKEANISRQHLHFWKISGPTEGFGSSLFPLDLNLVKADEANFGSLGI